MAPNDRMGSVAEASEALDAGRVAEGKQILEHLLQQQADDEALLAEQEKALLRLGQLHRDQQCVDETDSRDAQSLAKTVVDSRQFMASIAKAKTAKLVRILIDYFNDIPNSRDIQIAVTKENAAWAKQEKRIFLKQNLETKLIAQYFEAKAYRDALPLINELLKELKTLDDKMILTEVHLLESKVNHAIGNFPKAKAALTSARTSANSIYCPPMMQAQLDMQGGILHAEDKDFTTAASYFFETLEGFDSIDDARAAPALKYMLLCKIMLNLPHELPAILEGKVASKYAQSRDVQVMKAVAEAQRNRSLEEFERTLRQFKDELASDPIVRNHLSALYDSLLQQNLLRVIEPYSRIELAHIAKLVHQPVREVEQKLSQMILDKVFQGVLDQGAGCLVVFDKVEEDETYETALGTLKQISYVVDHLYQQLLEHSMSGCTMLLMSTWNKHYHWKTKGCTPWAKEWLTNNLVGHSATVGDGPATVKIDKLSGFEGDVELGNRKGKLITIYDCEVTLKWSSEADDTVVNGTIRFPEVSHEIEDNNETYRFETELLSESSKTAHDVYSTVRQKLAPSIESVFHRFRAELIDTHAKDLGHDDDAPAAAKEAAPVSSGAKAVPTSSSSSSSGAVSTSTAEVRVSSHLAISQADLWDLLTNPLRIPMWSKAPAQFSPNVGAHFSLFGGNISGQIVEVTAPSKLVQTWRVPQWPAGHHGTLTTELSQGDDSTKLDLILSGIPTGQEDNSQSGLENYYIRGLKSLGLGTIL